MIRNRLQDYAGPHYSAMLNRDEDRDATFRSGMPQHPPLAFPTQHKRTRRSYSAFWKAVIIFLLGMLAGRAMGADPASEVHAAIIHARSLPPQVVAGARYVSFYGVPEDEREEAGKVFSYAINALSRTRAITPIRKDDWIGPTLAVVYLPNYAPSAKEFNEFYSAWEKTCAGDSHFYLTTQVISATASHGAIISNAKPSTTTTYGGWVGIENAKALAYYTRSNVPIVDARYFIANALSTPNYYSFAGIPTNENDFVKSLGLQLDVIDRLRANAGANLLISGVTQKPRRVVWSQGPLGGYYATLDVQQVDAERDPVRRPITSQGLQVKFDATEIFAMKANGLWATALYDAKGKQQQTVPDRIAKDTSDPHGDGIVTPLISCIRCHTEGGLRPFSDDQVKLLSKSVLESYDPSIVLRALEFYDDARLLRQMQFDRETYEAAVKKCTGGWDSKQLAESLANVYRNYAYLPVNVDQAARECGVDVAEFKAATVRTHDPILLTLLEGREVLRGQWDSSQAEAQLTCAVRRKQ